MEAFAVTKNLTQFNAYAEPINLSFNQFLLMGSEPMLVHTGTKADAQALLPLLRKYLSGKDLAYVFVSHFESDECGGLALLLQEYAGLKVLCSGVTARQLIGFGIMDDVRAQVDGSILTAGDHEYEFISYPSEMHLWEGLVLHERNQSILFSADLFIQHGRIGRMTLVSNLPEQMASITLERIPSQDGRAKMQRRLESLPIRLIAPGHGACISIESASA
jgi:flavorubredoxin